MHGSPGYGQGYGAVPTPEKAAKQRRKARRALEAHSKASNFVSLAMVLCGLSACLWVVPVFGDVWISYSADPGSPVGPIAKELRLTASLWEADLELECMNIPLFQQFCYLFKPFFGKRSIRQQRDMACFVSQPLGNVQPLCNFYKLLYAATWLLFVGCLAGALATLAGAGCLYIYWYREPRAQLRQWAFSCLMFAPTFPTLAVGFFFLVVGGEWEFKQIVSQMSLDVFQGVGGSRTMPGMPKELPWCSIVLVLNIIVSMVLLALWLTFFKRHPSEETVTKNIELRQQCVEELWHHLQKRPDIGLGEWAMPQFSTQGYGG